MLVNGLLGCAAEGGGEELNIWADFVSGGQHCDEILIMPGELLFI